MLLLFSSWSDHQKRVLMYLLISYQISGLFSIEVETYVFRPRLQLLKSDKKLGTGHRHRMTTIKALT
jgi:hypothetical protein